MVKIDKLFGKIHTNY